MEKIKDQTRRNSDLFLVMSVVYVVCMMLANTTGSKIAKLGVFELTVGAFVFPVTYIISDMITEVYGFQKTRVIIWLGFSMNLLMIMFYEVAVAIPYPEYYLGQEAIRSVLGSSLRVSLASMTAYLFGSFTNATIISKMKVMMSGKHFGVRAITSTIFGQIVDSVIFTLVGFSFMYGWRDIGVMILTSVIVKSMLEIAILPITKIVVTKVKAYENLDVYDTDVSYRLFKNQTTVKGR